MKKDNKANSISKESQFSERLQNIYPSLFNQILECHTQDYFKTFRINNFKANVAEVLDSLTIQGFQIIESAIRDAYVCLKEPDNLRLSETKEALDCKIYMQELSSMIPALVLDLKPHDKVLDLCAAPGSKTTQMSDILQNNGEIVANEEGRERFFKLVKILKEYGALAKTLNDNGKILPYKYPQYVQYYDKILVDVPCSNEASLDLRQPSSFKFWKSSNSSGLSKLQKGLLASAITMLKPGGTLVYSTCTYAVDENESVVDWALKKFPDVKLEDIKFNEITEHRAIKNYVYGLTEYKNKKFNASLDKTIRILPYEYFKGFYVAKLVKQ